MRNKRQSLHAALVILFPKCGRFSQGGEKNGSICQELVCAPHMSRPWGRRRGGGGGGAEGGGEDGGCQWISWKKAAAVSLTQGGTLCVRTQVSNSVWSAV